MNNIDVNTFRVREGDGVDPGLWATKTKPLCKSKKAYKISCRTRSGVDSSKFGLR